MISAKKQEAGRKYRLMKKENGLCRDCLQPATIGRHCEKHYIKQMEYHRQYGKRRYANLSQEGKCPRCGGERESEMIECVNCRLHEFIPAITTHRRRLR